MACPPIASAERIRSTFLPLRVLLGSSRPLFPFLQFLRDLIGDLNKCDPEEGRFCVASQTFQMDTPDAPRPFDPFFQMEKKKSGVTSDPRHETYLWGCAGTSVLLIRSCDMGVSSEMMSLSSNRGSVGTHANDILLHGFLQPCKIKVKTEFIVTLRCPTHASSVSRLGGVWSSSWGGRKRPGKSGVEREWGGARARFTQWKSVKPTGAQDV